VSAAVAASLFAAAGAAAGSTTPTAAHTTATQTTAASPRPAVASPRVAPRASRTLQRAPWVRPAVGPVTSGYGRRWGSFHPGIDIGAKYGSPVRAITNGRILSAGWIAGYGKTVRVSADGLVFYYPHLSRILRRQGVVGTGTVLGRVGSTGFSTGPHLHVEIRWHGHSINPGPVLRRHGVRL
jgi:murein DD-endopeptidase MepM/ murein hydrolase activator NlpD